MGSLGPEMTRREFLKVLAVSSASLLISSCASATPENGLDQLETPIWSEADFRDVYQKLDSGDYVSYETIWENPSLLPPYYNNPEPFQFIAYYDSDYLHSLGIFSTLVQEFRELGFLNIFLPSSLSSPIPRGARTLVERGFMVAEARVLGDLVDENQKFKGIEIEEIHYGQDSKPVFRCKSQFDDRFYPILFKISQTEEIGRKSTDYYFIWPGVH